AGPPWPRRRRGRAGGMPRRGCATGAWPARQSRAGRALELPLRRRLATRRRLEVGLLPEAAQGRHEAAREEPEPRIVLAHRLVEAPPLNGDAVLRALELALQRQEVLVGLQLGVALDGDEQAAQRPAQLALGLLELLERRRVIEQLRRDLD